MSAPAARDHVALSLHDVDVERSVPPTPVVGRRGTFLQRVAAVRRRDATVSLCANRERLCKPANVCTRVIPRACVCLPVRQSIAKASFNTELRADNPSRRAGNRVSVTVNIFCLFDVGRLRKRLI